MGSVYICYFCSHGQIWSCWKIFERRFCLELCRNYCGLLQTTVTQNEQTHSVVGVYTMVPLSLMLVWSRTAAGCCAETGLCRLAVDVMSFPWKFVQFRSSALKTGIRECAEMTFGKLNERRQTSSIFLGRIQHSDACTMHSDTILLAGHELAYRLFISLLTSPGRAVGQLCVCACVRARVNIRTISVHFRTKLLLTQIFGMMVQLDHV